MARWRRAVLITAGGIVQLLAVLVCGVVLAAAVLAWRPELALTPPVLAKAVQHFGKAYHPRWSAFTLRLTSKSLRDKRLALSARDLCVDDSSGAAKGCLDSLDVEAALRFSSSGLELVTIRRFDARGRSIVLDLAKSPAQAPSRRRRGLHHLNSFVPRMLRRVRVEELDWRLADSTLRTTSSTISGDVTLAYSSGLALSAQLYYETRAKREHLDVRLKAESDLFTTGRLRHLKAVGTLDGDVDDHARFEVSAAQVARHKTAVNARLLFHSGSRRLAARFAGQAVPSLYSGRLAATFRDSSKGIGPLIFSPCDVEAPLSSEGSVEQVTTRCRVQAPLPAFAGLRLRKLDGTAELDLRPRPRPLEPDRFEATLHAAVAPPKEWYEVHAQLTARLAGRLGDLARSLEIHHDVEATLRIASFQDLVKYLRGTPYAVPAPFHVLDGPVTATLSSRGDPRSADQTLFYRGATDLSSGRQKLRARVEGRLLAKQALSPHRQVEDQTAVTLDEVAIDLPFLKLGKIPSLTPDSRIHTGEEPAPVQSPVNAPPQLSAAAPRLSTSSIHYVATIKTANPIELYTNLNPGPIPLSVDLTARPVGLSGTINVEPFKARLFKRDGQVDHVTLTARPGVRTMALNGLIKFHESAADVRLLLLGTTDKPIVRFESEPPMDQQQIIALLLFGKPPDDLDADQSTTVSNSQSAMATGAFGLASLYLFASTPVQYVGYDPGTQQYATRFSLPGGASLEVGSASDQSKHLTLRKRLASHWVIETELQRDPELQRNALSTFLEWFQRY